MKAAQRKSMESFRKIRKSSFALSGSVTNLCANSANVNMILSTLRIEVRNFVIEHVGALIFCFKTVVI